jgi:hypothetical protein
MTKDHLIAMLGITPEQCPRTIYVGGREVWGVPCLFRLRCFTDSNNTIFLRTSISYSGSAWSPVCRDYSFSKDIWSWIWQRIYNHRTYQHHLLHQPLKERSYA